MVDTLHKLTNSWTLWYHSPEDDDWKFKSYKKIYKFNTVEDYWSLINNIPKLHFSSGMFFLMKNDIPPLWEDQFNINGGHWSYKVYKKEASECFIEAMIATITEQICNNPEIVTGISISPKKGFCIIKVWNDNSEYQDTTMLNENIKGLVANDTIFKSHMT